ncbi:MAG: Rid family detoxifying hydrolase [Bacteroidetes bacterium]|nr:Rid family detoxifying hydrolase [Bacteroidota bacterium]MCY4225032.1 Rid family detoxifying hydrolase [Bacteroidota bacterium]
MLHTRKAIKTSNAPGFTGPYSQGILVGDTLYCAGQIATDPRTERFSDHTIEGQTDRVLKNLGAVLRCAGMSYEHVVHCTIFLRDLNDYANMNEVYSQYFTELPPSRETVAVSGLPRGALIKISCVAIK